MRTPKICMKDTTSIWQSCCWMLLPELYHFLIAIIPFTLDEQVSQEHEILCHLTPSFFNSGTFPRTCKDFTELFSVL